MTAGDRLWMTGADPRLLSSWRKKGKKEREVGARLREDRSWIAEVPEYVKGNEATTSII